MSEKAVALTNQSFLPNTLAECEHFANEVAKSNLIPRHFRGAPGNCLVATIQAREWGMSPILIMSKMHIINDQVAYEAQLVIAVINTRAPLEGRLNYDYSGDGGNLKLRVTGKIIGDPEIKDIEVEMATQTVKNSPLWKTNPRQQMGYLGAKMWARLHCPEVMLGVYTPDELEDQAAHQGPDNAKPVNDPPPRPRKADFKAPEVIDVTSAMVADPEPGIAHSLSRPYCVTDADGAVAETGDPAEAAALAIQALDACPSDAAVTGFADTNAELLDSLTLAGDDFLKPVIDHIAARRLALQAPTPDPTPPQDRPNKLFWARESLLFNPHRKGSDRPDWKWWCGQLSDAIGEAQTRDELMKLQEDNEPHFNALKLANDLWFKTLMTRFAARAEGLG